MRTWKKQRVEEAIDKVGGWKKRVSDENVARKDPNQLVSATGGSAWCSLG